MKTSEAISIIYRSMTKTHHHLEAKEHIANIMMNAIADIEMDDLPVTAENIEIKLSEKAEGYRDRDEEKSA